MPKKLTGRPSLAYQGVEAVQPPNITISKNAPTTSDYNEFNEGDFWMVKLDTNPASLNQLWYLAKKTGTSLGPVAVWKQLYPTSNTGLLGVVAGAGISVNTIAGIATITNTAIGGVISVSGTVDQIAVSPTTGNTVVALVTSPTVAGNWITTGGNFVMPDTTALQGQILQGSGVMSTPVFHTYGTLNTFVGSNCGNFTLDATLTEGNTAVGVNALSSIGGPVGGKYAQFNTCLGLYAGGSITVGQKNICIGYGTAWNSPQALTGSYNVLVGTFNADHWTGGEFNNIYIGHSVEGFAHETRCLRIGNSSYGGPPGSAGDLDTAFICGIRGRTTGNADAVPVLIDSANQLGTVSSSKRYKENIKDMSDMTKIISRLRPVEFNYKKHTAIDKQYGLIAEEVEHIWPEMMVYDAQGNPDTLKYQFLAPVLLKIVQDLIKRIEFLENKSI